MAKLEINGLDGLTDAFRRIANIPESLTKDALAAMASVAAAKVKQTGESMGVRDPESPVHILDKIKTTKPVITKAGGSADVTFSGTRQRGNTRTRNAEIAFVNEYGKRNQEPRPFIRTATEKYADAIVEPGATIIGDWIAKEFQK